jgi:hypothetical protein
MIKQVFIFCLLLAPIAGIAQQFSGKIINANPVAMDVVVFPFGMEYPIKIGTVDKDGQLQINLDDAAIDKVPDDTKELMLGRVSDNIFVKCNYPDSLQTSDKVKAINCEMPSLWYNNQMAGALSLVSDEKLQPWIQDRYYMEPVKASFFQIVYTDQVVTIHTSCNTTYNLAAGNVEATNHFNLRLKKGFNLLKFSIEEIHKTDPAETSSIPVKINVTNPTEQTTILWMGKYF